MDFSALNRKVEVYTLATAANTSGGQTGTWTLAKTIWCSLKQLSSHRQLSYNQSFEAIGYELIVRYNPSFIYTKEMKYKFDGKEMVASSVNNQADDKKVVKILCHYKQL